MAKNSTLRSADTSPIATNRELETIVRQLFVAAKFDVIKSPKMSLPAEVDLVARRAELGRERAIAIEISAHTNTRHLYERERRARRILNSASEKTPLDEFWIIYTHGDHVLSGYRPISDRRVRVLSLDELRATLIPKRPRKSSTKARTKIGKAVEANERNIQLAITALILQIGAKVEMLQDHRPNSPDAKAEREADISEFQRLRDELENIRQLIARFVKGKEEEAAVVNSVLTLKSQTERETL